jgi:hypothetical protein
MGPWPGGGSRQFLMLEDLDRAVAKIAAGVEGEQIAA